MRVVENIVRVNQAFCDILLSHLYHGKDDRMITHFSEKCQRDEIIKNSSKENMSLSIFFKDTPINWLIPKFHRKNMFFLILYMYISSDLFHKALWGVFHRKCLLQTGRAFSPRIWNYINNIISTIFPI